MVTYAGDDGGGGVQRAGKDRFGRNIVDVVRQTRRMTRAPDDDFVHGRSFPRCCYTVWARACTLTTRLPHVKDRGSTLIGPAARTLAGVQGKHDLGKEEEIALT